MSEIYFKLLNQLTMKELLQIVQLEPDFFKTNTIFAFEKNQKGALKYLIDCTDSCLQKLNDPPEKVNLDKTLSQAGSATQDFATETDVFDWADDVENDLNTIIRNDGRNIKNNPKSQPAARQRSKPMTSRTTSKSTNKAVTTNYKVKAPIRNAILELSSLIKDILQLPENASSTKMARKSPKARPQINRKKLQDHCISFVKRQKCKWSNCKYIHDVNPPKSVIDYVKRL